MSTIKHLVNEKNATIIDVRSGWEFEDGHIDGALNIPVEEIPQRIDEFKDLSQPFVVYCRSGARSSMAENLLKAAGFSEVHNGGGLADMRIALM